MLILKLGFEGRAELFLTELFSSQPCESYFKGARSFTPVGCTMLSFTLCDFLHNRCKKVDCYLRLTSLGSSEGIIYPRYEKNLEERYGGKGEPYRCTVLPSLDDIISIMEKVRKDVRADMEQMGVKVRGDSCFEFDSKLALKLITPDKELFYDECDEIEDEDLGIDESDAVDDYETSVLNTLCNGNFQDYTAQLEKRIEKEARSGNPELESNPELQIQSSPFLVVESDDGSQRVLRKSAFVWFLENSVRKHSNDRTVRVMQTSNFHLRQTLVVSKVEERKIRLGDWCVFKCPKKKGERKHKVLVGHVLSLSLLVGSKQERAKAIYSWERSDVGTLCDWYAIESRANRNERPNKVNPTGILVPQHMFSQGFHSCDSYVCSIPPPRISKMESKSVVLMSQETVSSLSQYIEQFTV